MPNTRAIKQRIKSAKNISKITKAMEMVSASKMRRSQEQAVSSRPYSHNLKAVLRKISGHTDPGLHPFLQKNEAGFDLLVIVSTDRGLVGGLNANLFRATANWVKEHPNAKAVSIGRKAQLFARKLGLEQYAEFSDLPDKITYSASLPISTLLINSYLDREVNSVSLLHMESVTTISQQPILTPLLPITDEHISDPTESVNAGQEYKFEPDAKTVLDWLLPYYIENVVYFTLLEGKASEHSARMIAMKNASDNAKEVVSVLGLEYNRSRQAAITQELQEITTAQLSLS